MTMFYENDIVRPDHFRIPIKYSMRYTNAKIKPAKPVIPSKILLLSNHAKTTRTAQTQRESSFTSLKSSTAYNPTFANDVLVMDDRNEKGINSDGSSLNSTPPPHEAMTIRNNAGATTHPFTSSASRRAGPVKSCNECRQQKVISSI